MKKLKIKKIKFLILLIFSIMIVSCELFLSLPKGRMVFLSIALDYKENSIQAPLNGTIIDAKEMSAAFATLSEKEGRDFYYIPVYQFENQNEIDKNSTNFPTNTNLDNIFNYLSNKSSAIKPLIFNLNKDLIKSKLSKDNEYFKDISDKKDLTLPLRENDLLIVYLAGHSDFLGNFSIVNNNSYSVENLYDKLNSITSKILVIVDSCFSGNYVPLSDTTISPKDPRNQYQSFQEKLNFMFDSSLDDKKKDLFVISAVNNVLPSGEYNISDLPKDTVHPHGVFTYNFLKSLGWDCSDDNTIDINHVGSLNNLIQVKNNNLISLDSIYNYIKINSLQKPFLIGGRQNLILFDFNN